MNSVSEFPHYSGLDLDVKDDFFRAYKFSPPACSDMAFATLFAWRDFFGYRVSRLGKFLIVYYVREGALTVLAPLLAEDMDPGLWGEEFLKLAGSLSAYCKSNAYTLEFSAIPEMYLSRIPADRFNIVDDRDHYDYVYRKKDLSTLEGRDYAPKRNLIRQFERNYSWSYEPLSEKNLSACRQFIEHWDVSKIKNGIIGMGAYCVACGLVDNFGALDLRGGLLYDGGKIVAATVASIVRDFIYVNGSCPTAVVHHENALTDHKGAYQMINRLFAENLPEDVVYINREEDLGFAGLRKAKMSYGPAIMIKKFRLTPQREPETEKANSEPRKDFIPG